MQVTSPVPIPTHREDERARVAVLLRSYGWNATSFQLLEPEFRYWFDDPSGDRGASQSPAAEVACVAYVEAGSAWVVAGPPIASEERIGEVAARFVEHARTRRKRVSFFAVERRFLDAIGMRSIAIGEQPIFDPQTWEQRQRGHRSLKEQLRRARAKSVRVERVGSSEAADPGAPVRREIERVIARWLSSRPMPAMAFLVELHPFGFAESRRYYVARCGGRTVGVLVSVPVYLRGGWFFEDLIRDPAAPNGTAEMLVDFAMRDIAADGCTFATLGLAPLSGDAAWLRFARRWFGSFYSFEGLRAFKAKFRPAAWDPIFLAYPRDRQAVMAVYDVLSAFGRSSVVRFGIASLFRAPAIVLRVLALLLIPWIALLALADPVQWFPSRTIQIAWIAFDIVIASILFALSRRWRQRLAIIALGAIACDVILTAAQAALFNSRRVRGLRDIAVIAISAAAPLFAAAVLTGGVRRRRRSS